MSVGQSIPRSGWLWLLIAHAAILVGLRAALPVWLPLMWLLIIGWRVQIFRGVWDFPGRLIKAVLVVSSALGLYMTYGHLKGLEPMVALLVCASLLKLLEAYRWRDLLLIVLLSYLMAATMWLFRQDLMISLLGAICVWGITTALLSFHQPHGHSQIRRSLRLSSRLVLHSLPLMLLLFLVMPRLGSLWAIPNPNAAKTGVSDSMSPGDFSRLGRSAEVAFRVTFQGAIPQSSTLYWRGLTLSHFDGRRWTRGAWTPEQSQKTGQDDSIQFTGDPIAYDVIMEPTQQSWLYSLPVARVQGGNIYHSGDLTVYRAQPVVQRLRYQATSYLQFSHQADSLTPGLRQQNLVLPSGFNPRALQQARRWLDLTGGGRAYLNHVLSFFRQNFYYTLEPPTLGRHTVDEFLFETRRGFCEHFAGSFVVLMRAAGIPARVVVGYQGGEINEDYLVVKQYDAHAWAEVWLEGQGWVRIDPTAVVSPERIEQGMASFNPTQETLSLETYRHIGIINRLRLQLDALNYHWQRAVMGYDSESQLALLKRWLGEVNWWRVALLFLLTGGGLLGLIFLWLTLGVKQPSVAPEIRLFNRFCERLSRIGLSRQAGETAGDFCRRVSVVRPDLAAESEVITRLFENIYYGSISSNNNDLALLKQRVAFFKPRPNQ